MLIASILSICALANPSVENQVESPPSPRVVAEFGSDDFRHLGRLEDLAYSPDGRKLASVSVDGHLNFWSAETAKVMGNFVQPKDEALFRVAFLDAQTLLYGTGENRLGALRIDSEGGLLPLSLESQGLGGLGDSGGGISVAPGGSHLCQWLLLKGEGVQLVNIPGDGSPGKRTILQGDGFRVGQVAWSEDGRLLAILTTNPLKALGRVGSKGQDSSRIIVFSTATGERVARIVSKDDLLTDMDFALVRSGESDADYSGLIVTGGQSGMAVWDFASGRKLSLFGTGLGPVTSLDARDRGDGTSDVVASTDYGVTESWRIHGEQAPEMLVRLPELGSQGRVSIRPGTKELRFAGIESRTISQWRLSASEGDAGSWAEDPYIPRHEGIVSALSSAPGRIASAGFDGYVLLWDYEVQEDGGFGIQARARLLANPNPQSLVTDAALSADGTSMVSCGRDGLVRQWDLRDGTATFGSQIGNWVSDNEASFTTVGLSPDGTLLTSVSADQILWVRDAATGALLRRFEGLSGLDFASSFSADGRFFAVGSSGVRIYNTETWEQVRVFKDLGSPIMDLDMSPNGSQIAITTAANSLLVKDVQSGGLISTWTDFQGRPSAVCWVNSSVLVAAGPKEAGFRILRTGGADGVVGRAGVTAKSPHGGDVQALTVLPTGEVVSAASDGFLHIWELGL